MNHRKKPKLTSNEKEAIDTALWKWGLFTRLEQGEVLDYSHRTALKELAELGTKIFRSRTGIQWPAEAEQMDTLLGELIKIRPKWGQAIKIYYTAAIEDDSVRTLAKAKGVSKSTYHEQIQKGREWIGLKLRSLHQLI